MLNNKRTQSKWKGGDRDWIDNSRRGRWPVSRRPPVGGVRGSPRRRWRARFACTRQFVAPPPKSPLVALTPRWPWGGSSPSPGSGKGSLRRNRWRPGGDAICRRGVRRSALTPLSSVASPLEVVVRSQKGRPTDLFPSALEQGKLNFTE